MPPDSPKPSVSKVLDRENPFPGLRYFVEDEAQFFIGRDTEVKELIRRIKRDSLTTLFGISGLGKTSLLLAGVFPELRAAGFFPVRIRIEFFGQAADFAAQVIRQTRAQAEELGIETTEPGPDESLWEYFHRAEFWGRRSRLLQPVLVLDQFEEIFSLGSATKDRRVEPFVEELGDLIENRIPRRDRRRIAHASDLPYSVSKQPCRIVLSMREDFLPELESWHKRIPSIRHNRMRLRPMNGIAALKVVTQVPDRVTDELAEKIVRYVAKDEKSPLETLDIEPALLSVVCRELNRRRIAKNLPVITEGLLEVAREELLQKLYEECLDRFPDVRAALQREIEGQLLTKSGMRDNVAVEDFLDEESGITEAVLQDLVEERLVRIEERSGVKRLELSHDRWTDVVASSRDERMRREARQEQERERQEALAAERAEARAREERLRASRKRLRRTFAWSAAAALATIAAVVGFALYVKDQSAQLDEALKQVREVNRDFGAIQESVNELGASLADLAVVEEQLALLRDDGTVGGSDGINALEGRSAQLRDSIREDYAYLQTLSERFSSESDDVARTAVASQLFGETDPEASPAQSAGRNSQALLPVQELKDYYRNDLQVIRSALAELESIGADPEHDGYRNDLLEYLSLTSLSAWRVKELKRAFVLLDDDESNPARRALSHINLAALGLQDEARDGAPGNDEGRILRQARNTFMQSTLADSPPQIAAALESLIAGNLNPRARYNAMWYLSETRRSAWTDANLEDGCRIVSVLESDGGIGKATRTRIGEAYDLIGPCR
jgi:hypothetical protein